jgi:hypothetical protein
MGQSINVLLYGCRIPEGIDYEALEALREQWMDHVAPKVKAFAARLKGVYAPFLAEQAYRPETPCPDDAKPDDLIGFYICRGYHDHAESHRFSAMTFAEMRQRPPTAAIIKRCRRRWSRFARWARRQGVEFGKPRIWRTRAEVA